MLRKLLEAGGVILGSTVVSAVLDFARSGSEMTPEAWAVSALVPLGLLLIYWIWIEPRHKGTSRREGRFRRGLDRYITRNYKESPGDISPEGRMHEDAPDLYRRKVYEQVGIPDLFVPNPRNGRAILAAKVAEGRGLLTRAYAEGLAGLTDDLMRWERQTAEDVAFYQQGPLRKGQAAGFTKHSFTTRTDDQAKLRRIEGEIRELELYVKDQEALARHLDEQDGP